MCILPSERARARCMGAAHNQSAIVQYSSGADPMPLIRKPNKHTQFQDVFYFRGVHCLPPIHNWDVCDGDLYVFQELYRGDMMQKS